MTPVQLRMARAALKLTVREVEQRTGVNKDSISRFEAGREILAGALKKLEELFREEGVVFIDGDASGGEGVRLPGDAKSQPPPPRAIGRRVAAAKSGKRSQKTK